MSTDTNLWRLAFLVKWVTVGIFWLMLIAGICSLENKSNDPTTAEDILVFLAICFFVTIGVGFLWRI